MTWLARVLVAVLAAAVLTQPATATTAPGIVGGQPASTGDYPWVVALVDQQGRPFCDGTLTASTTVVTAAHCLLGRTADNVLVLGGRTDLSQITDGETLSGVSQVQVSPTFTAPQAGGDIATLTLQNAFPYRPLPMATATDTNLYLPGVLGTVLGWGGLGSGSLGSGTDTTVLHELTVPVVATGTCRTEYDHFVSGARYDDSAMFCAGYVNEDAGVCTGDAGGPLVVDGKLAGIVSWSVGCGRYPDFYTKVASY